MKTAASYLIIVLTAAVLFSCGSGKPEIIRVDPGFSEYVSGYTSGMVSRQSPIRVRLADLPLANEGNLVEKLKDPKVLEEIFEFEPEIKGKAVMSDQYTIEFIPEGPLPENQFYDVHFDLERLAEVKSGYEDFHFQFSTYTQNLFVDVDGIYDIDSYNLEYRSVRGTITTSDFAEFDRIQKTVTAVYGGKNLHVNFEEGYENNTYSFYIDSILRGDAPSDVTIKWDGSPIKASQSGSEKITVSAIGDFKVDRSRVIDKGDQSVELQFSEPIAQQDLNGIITIEGEEKLTYAIDYNLVTIYLQNRIIGERKVSVTNGLKNVRGHHIKNLWSETMEFKEPNPLLRIKGNGSILPNSKGLIFPFEAISLKSVEVRIIKIYENNIHNFLQINDLDGEDGLTRFGKVIVRKRIKLDYDKSMNLKQWNSHVIDLNSLIKADPGAIYRVSLKFSREDAVCDCPEREDENTTPSVEPERQNDDWNEDNWHGYGFDDGFDSWEYYEENYEACSDSYYNGKAVNRNILASDLGMIFKLDEDKLSHAFINDMLTTDPAANVEVQYFDFSRQLIASGTTDAQGMLDVKLSRKPFLMIAKRGKQRGYLKLRDEKSNSLSKFDIEGESVQNGVKGFIYGERGVWRPGDSIYTTLILQDIEHALPAGHPVKFELRDPNGNTIYETTTSKNVNGSYDFRTKTDPGAITGYYTATARVGNREFSRSILVETVKPNRLKIYLDLNERTVRDSLSKLTVKWLHGAIAKDLKANIMVSVYPSVTKFEGYKNYNFDSPVRYCNTDQELVFDGKVNNLGEALIRTKLQNTQNAPGKIRASYLTKVFEKGGDFSIDKSMVIYSPFKTYIGISSPESDSPDNTLETDKNHKLSIVALDESGKPSGGKTVQVKIYKLEWRWWYESGSENLAEFISKPGTIIVKDTTIDVVNGKSAINFRVKYPEYGRYLVTATDTEGQHQTGEIITVDWPYWSRANRSENQNASMLNFACDKEKYLKGEQVKVSFPSPEGGRALISVETSKRVVKKFWVKTVKGETTQSFIASEDMSPNAYVHITLIQPHSNTQNDLPIRMYGVIPIMVDDPETHLHPEIMTAEKVRPESTMNVSVKERDGKKMTYTLAVVDDGLLDLTHFKTPQPWNTFYAREALGVTTWDMYDYVIGAYSGRLDKMISIGGDGSLDNGESAKANRFKPVVRHLGPFTLEPGKTAAHKVELPSYMGSVRVMVVAQNNGAYGSAESTVTVTQPLISLATLPRVLGPDEEVELPVNVFATEKQIKNVTVTIECNDMLTAITKTQKLTFDQPGDEVVNFKLKAAAKTGIARVKIITTSGNERSVEEIELDVRTPNPVVTEGQEIAIQPGKSYTADLAFFGVEGTNEATVEASTMPAIGLERRLDYLINYPHGCIEQTTSGAFPQLFLSRITDLDEKQKTAVVINVKAALKRLQLFQTSNGGFAYWPGEYSESEWGTNYAGHFMIEAEMKGYTVPAGLKKRWMKYEKDAAKNWSPERNPYVHSYARQSNELTQAYRLYVLALSKEPEIGAMNRLREEPGLSPAAKWRLAAAYQLTSQPDIAKKLISGLSTAIPKYTELSYSYGSDTRDKAMILETLILMDEQSKAAVLAKEIAKELSSEQWMSTQETAYSLLAMCNFSDGKEGETNTLAYNIGGKPVETTAIGGRIKSFSYTEKQIGRKGKMTLTNKGKKVMYVRVTVKGSPLTEDKKFASSGLEMKVRYLNMEGMQISPENLTQGMDFVAEVTLRNPTQNVYREMTLNQIFPSGWEIHNSRLYGGGTSDGARYKDIRDDRVYSYYDIAPKGSLTIQVQLNATYLGKFYMPSTYSEAMYDHLINAKVPGKWVNVIRS